MSGKRNVSVCRGHELANALYREIGLKISVIIIIEKKINWWWGYVDREHRGLRLKGRQAKIIKCPSIWMKGGGGWTLRIYTD